MPQRINQNFKVICLNYSNPKKSMYQELIFEYFYNFRISLDELQEYLNCLSNFKVKLFNFPKNPRTFFCVR